jgi:diadenosine tetraphosphate (Ap4A) HIT family hydrolase
LQARAGVGKAQELAMETFSLHPQLEQDTFGIADLPLSRLLLSTDANYPWLLLVPRRPGAIEIFELTDADQAQLTLEVSRVARALKTVTLCDKINVAAIGNVVPQLHVHIVARRRSDPAWPRPIWGMVPPRVYAASERERLVASLLHHIGNR